MNRFRQLLLPYLINGEFQSIFETFMTDPCAHVSKSSENIALHVAIETADRDFNYCTFGVCGLDTGKTFYYLVLDDEDMFAFYEMADNQFHCTITSRNDCRGNTLHTEELEEKYPGINSHRLLLDEEDFSTEEKLALLKQYEQGLSPVPLLWYLPINKEHHYFKRVLNSNHSPFASIFQTKDGKRLCIDGIAHRPLNDLYTFDGATVLKEIDRWYSMGGEKFFEA
jgi:hypothetical protein